MRVGCIMVLALIWVLASALASSTAYVGTKIDTRRGVVVEQFTGIPFALPPTGAWRWQAPRPAPMPVRVDATAWPPICMQDDDNTEWYRGVAAGFGQPGEVIPPTPPVSEDCLFLNVWTPDRSARLPVMVWIHGGSNVNGWSFEPNYRGHELAARGVVVVSIQYRLGVFGFFAHRTLSKESSLGASGNYGTLDQLEALAWIQRHIHVFGGDPHNVTVFGESAGGGNVGYLLLSPLSDGLFHKAISQSGRLPYYQRETLADAEEKGRRFLARVNVATIEAARAIPASELLVMAAEGYLRDYDDPPVDGRIVPATPQAMLAGGEFRPRPVIIGTNRDEWLMYVSQLTEQHWREMLATASPDAENAKAIETLLQNQPLAKKLDTLASAVRFVCPAAAFVEGLSSAGVPTYVYRFDKVRNDRHGLGAYHGAEIPYVFDTHDAWLPTDEADRALTDMMMNYWLSFARTGDPNHPGVRVWPRWLPERRALVLDTKVSTQAVDTRICAFLERP